MARRIRLSSAVAIVCALSGACSSDDSPAPGSASDGDSADGGSPSSSTGDGNGNTGNAGATNGGNDAHLPTDTSIEGIQAFLEAERHDGEGWTRESEAPREPISDVSPHGRVRVHVNQALVDSVEAGNGASVDAPPHDAGSMAVKELYDDSDALVGRATILWLDDDVTLYYCHGPARRCTTEGEYTREDPLYSDSGTSGCAICHGGLVYSVKPGQL